MPRYTFQNRKTKKRMDLDMPWSELEKFIKHNPNLEQVFVVNVADPVNIGITRPPSDFSKYVLGKVQQMPGADKQKMSKRWDIKREI